MGKDITLPFAYEIAVLTVFRIQQSILLRSLTGLSHASSFGCHAIIRLVTEGLCSLMNGGNKMPC